MKKTALSIVLSLCAAAVSAQDVSFNMVWGEGDVESVLTASKSKSGSYSVCVMFPDKPQLNSFVVMRGSSVDVVRFPAKDNSRYMTNYYPGEINGRPDFDFVYRLPLADGKETQVHRSGYMQAEHQKWYDEMISYQFAAKEGDDVFAMRKGEVVEIENAEWFLRGVAQDKILRNHNKVVVVEHSDGTRARYVGLLDGTINVKPGETVYPDTIIGKAGTLNDKDYYVEVNVMYLTAPVSGVNTVDFQQVKIHTFDPVFLTAQGETMIVDEKRYGVKVTGELIAKEMSKREQKRRK